MLGILILLTKRRIFIFALIAIKYILKSLKYYAIIINFE